MPDINIDKNVYLLGAGFSKEVGLPLQDDFLLVAKEVYFNNRKQFNHFQRVFEYQDTLTKMKYYLNYPLLNLEHLFNLIEMDMFYSNTKRLKNIKKDFTKLICDVIIEKTPFPFIHNASGHLMIHDAFRRYLSFISLLIKNDKNGLVIHNDSIITFNYDLVLEAAACIYNWKRVEKLGNKYILGNLRGEENRLKFNTLFDKTNIITDDVSNCYKKDRHTSYFPDSNIFSEGDNSIKLIKLHGSINWKTVKNGETFIVPPTWNKSDTEIRRLWNKAYSELTTAKRIIVIGYSFPETDIYVKSLLALALNDNNILQSIYFINPDKDIVKKSSLLLLDNYFEKYCSYKEWKFSEFIGSVEGKQFIKDNLNREVT